METTELSELAVFAAVARHRSFRQAATERGTSASAISHSIRNLETRVGIRLFHRTTRSVSLTDAGEMLFSRLEPALTDMRAAVDALNSFRATPFGTIRLNVPNSLAPYLLREVVPALLASNPGLKLEVVATDSLVDIVEGGFDAGIRPGERLSQDMIAVRIKPSFRFTVVGAPSYLARKPAPRTPQDLKVHDCIRYAFPSGAIFGWELAKDGEAIQVDVDGSLTLDSQELMVEAAAQGVGLAYVWEDRAVPYIADGRLRYCLEDWCTTQEHLFLYFPSRKHQSAGLRALIEAMKA
ncbi:LysR family transcriptional regulator [Dyella japonica]|uniref:Transcriptional regulator n=1 Tax=Dyella japonica DSM 16301 TaxID=1440762 RepID=A0A0G9H2V1_9GAMM|nr:LysR family transcriptional regulator [Dyella japonica]KLD62057.1 transcriptional regulator [Dyella japonica DSM 16301]